MKSKNLIKGHHLQKYKEPEETKNNLDIKSNESKTIQEESANEINENISQTKKVEKNEDITQNYNIKINPSDSMKIEKKSYEIKKEDAESAKLIKSESKKIENPKKMSNDLFASGSDSESEKENQSQQPSNFREVIIRNETGINNSKGTGVKNDEELYYKPVIGEVINKKYTVVSILGKGVYSLVLKVKCEERVLALKILRKAELLKESGRQEVQIIKSLQEKSGGEKNYVIEIVDSFEHEGFLCIALEFMGLNLRDMLDSQRKGKNFSLEEVRLHGWEILKALSILEKSRILHLDIKPDNILYDADRKTIRLSDFGTSMEIEAVEQGKEYVSRYYRSPEVFLGGPLGYGVDVWSVGATLFEMLTGEFLFPGNSDAHMMALFHAAKGRFALKFLKKCQVIFLLLLIIDFKLSLYYYFFNSKLNLH